MKSNDLIQFFDSGVEPKLEQLGGKGASLVSMTAAGMPVPPGFVVTCALFDEFMAAHNLHEKVNEALAGLNPEDVDEVEAISAKVREKILSAPVPPASFAGQQDTYLWLEGFDTVGEHIRKCWASLYTARAILYRLKNNIPDEGLSMAVVVQKMVNAKVSGVAMTLDPATGDRSKITVDSSYGVGEMVVSGQVTPDNIMVDKVTMGLVSEHIGDKHAELVPDFAARTLIERDVEADRRAARSLNDEELTAVATMAKRAEKHYGCPQDIEWALDADLPDGENLLLLQSRPETVHSATVPAAKPAATGGYAANLTGAGGALGAYSLSSITSAFIKN